MVREPETVNAQLRRYVAAGSASLTTIAREVARLAVAPILSAHADGSLTNLDEPAVSRLRTAAGAVGFAVSAAPAAGCPDARAAAIQVGTIAVEILRVHAILLRDRRQPWAFGSDTLPYHLATPLQAAAERIAVPSQAHAQAQLDRHQHEMLAAHATSARSSRRSDHTSGAKASRSRWSLQATITWRCAAGSFARTRSVRAGWRRLPTM